MQGPADARSMDSLGCGKGPWGWYLALRLRRCEKKGRVSPSLQLGMWENL